MPKRMLIQGSPTSQNRLAKIILIDQILSEMSKINSDRGRWTEDENRWVERTAKEVPTFPVLRRTDSSRWGEEWPLLMSQQSKTFQVCGCEYVCVRAFIPCSLYFSLLMSSNITLSAANHTGDLTCWPECGVSWGPLINTSLKGTQWCECAGLDSLWGAQKEQWSYSTMYQ